MRSMEQIYEAIAKLASDGEWWHSDNEDKFKTVARQLVELGLCDELIIQILTDLYFAAAGEFGSKFLRIKQELK